jgi:CheY-like chemotaxis protein
MQAFAYRILVVSDCTERRQHIGMLLRDLLVETYWLNDASEVIEYAWWCQPRLILIAMAVAPDAQAAYAALQSWLGTTPIRIVMVGAPQDGSPAPSPQRLALDGYLPPRPTLHELAWQVQRCVPPSHRLFTMLGRAPRRRFR